MLRRLNATISLICKSSAPKHRYSVLPNFSQHYRFSEQKGLTPAEIPAEHLKIKASSTTVGNEEIDYFRTEGGISILDKVPGVKADNGELYVLSFRCNKCNTQSIRSFTKHAYHKGVVLVRCGGCPHTHLVADNLGWFQDDPVNIETMYQDKVKKVRDHVAIVKFLQAALGDEPVDKQENASDKVDNVSPASKQE